MAEEEMLREGEYRRYRSVELVKPCDCDGPGVMGGVSIKEDGKAYCTSCSKELTILRYILFGCDDCGEKKFKEADKLEKQFYRNLPKMFNSDHVLKNADGVE